MSGRGGREVPSRLRVERGAEMAFFWRCGLVYYVLLMARRFTLRIVDVPIPELLAADAESMPHSQSRVHGCLR